MSPTKPRDTDVMVVGAGPAGSVVAGLLAGMGFGVVVVDRAVFPRSKPCGESVNPGAVRALERLGLLDAVLRAQPSKIDGWVIRSDGGSAAVGAYGSDVGPGFGIARSTLDHLIMCHARHRGATVLEGCRVEDVSQSPGAGVTVQVRGPEGRWVCRPRVLVGADGLRSVVARRLGLTAPIPGLRKMSLTCHVTGRGPARRHGVLHQGVDSTVGTAPIDAAESTWNVTVVVNSDRRGREVAQAPLEFFRREVARSAVGWDGDLEVVRGPWASGPFDWPARGVSEGDVLLVGDAAGYYDPFTGQGIHQALRSAELAVPAIAEALHDPRGRERAFQNYGGALSRQMRGVRVFQRGVEAVMSRATLRGAVVRGLARAPRLADRVVRVAGDVAPIRSLLGLGAQRPGRGRVA
jgi:flavin-dependent dehydrogenase